MEELKGMAHNMINELNIVNSTMRQHQENLVFKQGCGIHW